MISRGTAVTASALLLAAAGPASCAAPGDGRPPGPAPGPRAPPPAHGRPAGPAASAVPGVPSGCDLPGAGVRWSAPATSHRLTQVTLFRVVPEDAATHTGKVVLDEPLAPSVTGLTVPAHWPAELARSLRAETGHDVRSGPAVMADGGYTIPMDGGPEDPAIPETLWYAGVEAVSADFTVACAAPVSGTFTSWTTLDYGGVACGGSEQPIEPLGRLAIRFCPRTAPALPSGAAVPGR